MSHHQEDDAEYLVDENKMEDVEEDEMDIQSINKEGNDVDSDDDEYDFSITKALDTTADQARRGKDIQAIPWDKLNVTRESYRDFNKSTKKGNSFYEFRRNSRSVKPTILHFQLRNLVWATSKHDAYFLSQFSVMHWSSLTCTSSEVLNVSGHVAPSEKHPGSVVEGFTHTQVSTLAVKDNLLVIGGFQGELICKHLDRPGVSFCSRTANDDNGITNAIEIYATPSGAVHFTVASNDCAIRNFDMEKFQLSKHFCFPWPVNHTSMSPDGKLLLIVGDNPESILVKMERLLLQYLGT
ncbi:transducin/WD40 repeat protein [Medicago truncatula]|uniref:Transducin/WD40 repeat protein n=1 Tax=Medicago truncatula TaxID=3880 RepID=G7J0E9_MEDTR|nr:transducin/WD40 repeat protein [Medicago truncatula]